VEVLAWSSESLYTRAFINESWEADVVYEELKASKFKFLDYDSYVRFSLYAGIIILQIPKLLIEKDLQGDAAEIQKLKLSNRTLNHRMAALEQQMKIQKGKEENERQMKEQMKEQMEQMKFQIETLITNFQKMSQAQGGREEAQREAGIKLEQLNGKMEEEIKKVAEANKK